MAKQVKDQRKGLEKNPFLDDLYPGFSRKFYSEGIRFECQGTGKCCLSRGEYGYVYLTLPDRRRLAAHLGLSTSQFTRRYCAQTEGFYHLKNPEKNCQFLEGKRCGVYSGRPTQCRTWPFWPENMNAKTWGKEVAPYCAGVGKGKLYSLEEIETLLREKARDDLSQ
jgi:Fe-S-cluster containining protein